MDQRECILNEQPDTRAAREIHQEALRTPWGFIVRSLALIVLAVVPSIICACLSQSSSSWYLFERSGSLITIAGLLLASRRYLEHSVTDLVVAHSNENSRFKPGKVLGDVLDARRGLTLSAFGTLIWGWGSFLRWWSFGVLALWMAFVIYRAFRDPVLQRRRGEMVPASE